MPLSVIGPYLKFSSKISISPPKRNVQKPSKDEMFVICISFPLQKPCQTYVAPLLILFCTTYKALRLRALYIEPILRVDSGLSTRILTPVPCLTNVAPFWACLKPPCWTPLGVSLGACLSQFLAM